MRTDSRWETDGLIKVNAQEDLTGRTFGKLTVIERGPDIIKNKLRLSAWWCMCSCGNPERQLIHGAQLKNGHVKSCGCLYKDRYYKNNNCYDLTGDFGRCIMNDKSEFIFDLEDYDYIRKHGWRSDRNGYIRAKIKGDNSKIKYVFLHRYLMNVHNIPCDGYLIDHINGNVKDNRKCNLRVATPSENSMNSKKRSNNTSGVTGVKKYKGKWVACIRVRNERIYLGIYNNFEDAVKVRKEAEEKYFGEFSYDNSRLRGDRVAVYQ